MNTVMNKTGTNRKSPIDYNSYEMKIWEKLLYTVSAAGVIYGACYVFYRSHIFSMAVSLLALLYPSVRVKSIIKGRKKLLQMEFRDMLYSLSSSVSAGQTVEKAFDSVRKDLSVQYADPDDLINKEAALIVGRLDMNEPVEDVLADLAGRSKIEDIESFADVFRISKRSGGNLVEVIRNSFNIINDKLDICQEIDVILAERKLERKVLTVLPVGLILLLSLSAGDYMRPVFETITGRFVMTLSLLLMLAANLISARILDIKV